MQQPVKNVLVEFRAGRCIRDGTKVKPDLRKGLVYVHKGDEGLVHFCWKALETEQVEEDLIVFPFDAEFKKVSQSKDRVFVLKFNSSDARHFYWAQEGTADGDEALVQRINDAMNVGDEEENGDEDEEMSAPVPVSSTAVNAGEQQQQQQQPLDPLAQLREMIRNAQAQTAQQQKEDIDFSDILNVETLAPLLTSPSICAELYNQLPPNAPQTPEEIREVLRSTTFQHTLQSLTYALRTGQLGLVLHELGVGPHIGSVKGLLEALRIKAKKNEKSQDNNTRMETD